MQDETFTLVQTNKERKAAASGARHRVNGSRSKRVTLPSDHLTPAQVKKLSGPVVTFNMDKPHTLTELRQWPADLRREYLVKIVDTYLPDNGALGEMLNISRTSIPYVLANDFDLHRSRSYRPARDQEHLIAWQNFLHHEQKLDTTDTTEDTEPEIITAPETAQDDAQKQIVPKASWVTSLTMDLPDVRLADLVAALLNDPLLRHLADDTYHITLRIERSGS